MSGSVFTFGVSGRLYKSNVLIYDHQSESLWSQLMGKAVTGPLSGTALVKIPSQRMRWKTWKRLYPDTIVLSTTTGYQRDYSIDPYTGYYRIGEVMFPVGRVRKDLPTKTRILGLEINGKSKAYPLSTLQVVAENMRDNLGGVAIRIEIDPSGQVVGVYDKEGLPVHHLFAYWFAWQAFHPETDVYRKTN